MALRLRLSPGLPLSDVLSIGSYSTYFLFKHKIYLAAITKLKTIDLAMGWFLLSSSYDQCVLNIFGSLFLLLSCIIVALN
jgi:hypothetical protein